MRINWDRVASLSLGIVTVILIVLLLVLKSNGVPGDSKYYDIKINKLEHEISRLKRISDSKITEKSDDSEIAYRDHELELIKLNTSGDLYLIIVNGKGMLIGEAEVSEYQLIKETLLEKGIGKLSHMVMKSPDYMGYIKLIETFEPDYLFYKAYEAMDDRVSVAISNLKGKGKLIFPLYGSVESEMIQSNHEREKRYRFHNFEYLTELSVYLDKDQTIRSELLFYGEIINL